MPARPYATQVVKRLVEAGHTTYFAGGWVRDFLMGARSDDIDIATSATVEQIQELFPKTIPVGVAFGIVIVVQEGHQFEVATFRKDRGYTDGRRPTGIDPATPEEDAQRRDFTINGMFYDPLNERLIDYVHGQEDIKRRIIRAIGNANERFAEDRLRMMRAVRYSTRFNFPIEEETLKAILAHAQDLLPAVAMERIWQEFKKMSHFAHFDSGLVTLHRLHLLQTIFPVLKGLPLEEIKKRVQYIPRFPKNTPTFAELMELFHDSSLEQLLDLCDYLKLSNEERSFVDFYFHAKNLLTLPTEWQERLELAEWAHFYASPYADLSIHLIGAHFSLEEQKIFFETHTKLKERLHSAIKRIQTKQPVVRAEHLIHQGVQPGVRLGKLLKEAERISINEEIEDRDTVLSLLKGHPLWPYR